MKKHIKDLLSDRTEAPTMKRALFLTLLVLLASAAIAAPVDDADTGARVDAGTSPDQDFSQLALFFEDQTTEVR